MIKNSVVVVVVLICMFIVTLQLKANADVLSEGLFDKYNDDSYHLNIDKFVDAMRSNEVDVDNKKTIEFLETLTKHDLQMLRNTFYAKHGLIFNTTEMQNYFNNKRWYIPQQNHITLPAREDKIVSIIKKIENCENVKFDDFRKLFTPLSLPLTYGDDLERKRISMINIRKFINARTDVYLPYYAIGELYNKKFIALLFETSSLETQPGIATFGLDGKLIADKRFYSIGGDLTSATTGTLFIDKDLTIHIEEETTHDQHGNEIVETKSEIYRIDLNGHIVKVN